MTVQDRWSRWLLEKRFGGDAAAAERSNIPSLAEAMKQVLTSEEAQRLEAHVRPRIEAGGGQSASASAYLRATKDGTPTEEPHHA